MFREHKFVSRSLLTCVPCEGMTNLDPFCLDGCPFESLEVIYYFLVLRSYGNRHSVQLGDQLEYEARFILLFIK